MSITQYICIPCKKIREICWKLRGKRNVCTLACLALTCVSLCSAGSHCKGTSHKSIGVARTVVFPPMTASFTGLRIISVVDLSQILQGGDTCRKCASGNPDLHPLFFHYDFYSQPRCIYMSSRFPPSVSSALQACTDSVRLTRCFACLTLSPDLRHLGSVLLRLLHVQGKVLFLFVLRDERRVDDTS